MVYLLIFLSVVLHEAAHITTAFFFGLKTDKFVITPLGCVAYLKDLHKLSSFKKIIVLAAGPLTNLVIGIACLLIFKDRHLFFRNSQFALAVFNLLPVYPLDGGTILFEVLKTIRDELFVNKAVYKVSRVISVLITVTGVFQLINYQFNFTLLFIGVYLFFCCKKVYMSNIYQYFKNQYTNSSLPN